MKKLAVNMKNKIAKCIRVLTTAPVAALVLVTVLYALMPSSFAGKLHFLAAILFLTVLPILAYPVSYLLPNKKYRAREEQRRLAILFAIVGYVGGAAFGLLCGGARIEILIYLTYLASGAMIALNTRLKIKSSGHACGVSGPITLLTYCLGAPFSAGYLLLIAVYWSSLQLKRHTVGQLVTGTAIPIVAMFILKAMV